MLTYIDITCLFYICFRSWLVKIFILIRLKVMLILYTTLINLYYIFNSLIVYLNWHLYYINLFTLYLQFNCKYKSSSFLYSQALNQLAFFIILSYLLFYYNIYINKNMHYRFIDLSNIKILFSA